MEVNAAANTVLLRILLSNDYTGVYADTITSAAAYPYPFYPSWNFTDSIVYKDLTAIDDSTVIMALALPGMFQPDKSLIMHIRSDNSIWLKADDTSINEILTFALVNSVLHPYAQPANGYFNIPYYYYSEFFSIKERLRKL